jgi:hypothetical protein
MVERDRPAIEITEEMVEAGAIAMESYREAGDPIENLRRGALAVFEAMAKAAGLDVRS